jgi:hypothetical protein
MRNELRSQLQSVLTMVPIIQNIRWRKRPKESITSDCSEMGVKILLRTSHIHRVLWRVLCTTQFPFFNTSFLGPAQYLSIYLWLYNLLLDLGPFFSFLILYTVYKTPWTGDEPVARPLPTRRTTWTQNKHTQTSMPWEGFEPTTPAFERTKTIHALDRAATVIDPA